MSGVGVLPPKMMVLGMVVREPDTASGVARRLADEFASARLAKNAAHDNMPSLAGQGYLRLVKKGGKSAHDLYEATPEGVGHFREWMRRAVMPPTLRDELQGKLGFLELEELAALVREVQGLEKAYRRKCQEAHARLLHEQETFRRVRDRGKNLAFRDQLRCIQTQDEVAVWEATIHRLERLREELEEFSGSIAAEEDDDG